MLVIFLGAPEYPKIIIKHGLKTVIAVQCGNEQSLIVLDQALQKHLMWN